MLAWAVLELRSPGHPDWSLSFHSLALYLPNRFDEHGRMDDLEEAITFGRAAIDLRSIRMCYARGRLRRSWSILVAHCPHIRIVLISDTTGR